MRRRRDGQCTERDDDLAAYALGALEPEEAQALEAQLDGCQACAGRLRWLQPAVELVPASVPQLGPPPALRERLITAAYEETGGRKGAGRRVGGWAGRLSGLVPTRRALAAFAGAALVAVGVVTGYALSDADRDGARTYAVFPLSPQLEVEGSVRVVDGFATLAVENLPPLHGDRVYQAWVRDGEAILPSSVFVRSRDGEGLAAIPDLPKDADELLVTREPAGGSESATTSPIFGSALR